MSPFDNWSPLDILRKDGIGTNAGNMVFANSVMRALMTDHTEIHTINTAKDLTPENLERINCEYDCVVLPFANAFRISFQHRLKKITEFVRQLKIPCVVVGVGISTPLRNSPDKVNVFDETVTEFVKAILEKSVMIGTRGQVTSDYLTRLGFKESRDHCVIGCPSMFWYGDKLPEMNPKELDKNSAVSVNWKMDLPEEIHRFIYRNVGYFENFHYVPQVTDEIRLMYYGVPLPDGKYKRIPEGYPSRADHPWYLAGKARSFLNMSSWFEYMKGKDFSFGSRIHGNITAVLSGTPCFIVVSDYRIAELAQYHHIPHIDYRDLKEDDNIFDFYEKADYSRVYEGHKERFENYRDFLEKNGLEHIFGTPLEDNPPYDQKIKELSLPSALKPFFSADHQEQADRLAQLHQGYLDLRQDLDQKSRELRQERADLQKKYDSVKHYEAFLKYHNVNRGLRWLSRHMGEKKTID